MGKSGARLRLDAALEAAEDGHVAGVQVRRAVRREEAQYDDVTCLASLHVTHGPAMIDTQQPRHSTT